MLGSTMLLIQASFQQEVESANQLRKAAVEASEKSLLKMQTKVDNYLQEMDMIIKVAHEAQTLNDQNIQTMMTKMDIFGCQMQRMEEKLNVIPNREKKGKCGSILDEDMVSLRMDEDKGENEWIDDYVATPTDFDAIISDAESPKTQRRISTFCLQRGIAKRGGQDKSGTYKGDTAKAVYGMGEIS